MTCSTPWSKTGQQNKYGLDNMLQQLFCTMEKKMLFAIPVPLENRRHFTPWNEINIVAHAILLKCTQSGMEWNTGVAEFSAKLD